MQPDLFTPSEPSGNNLLPYDGEAHYLETLFNDQESAQWLATLSESIAWQRDQVTMFGKTITTDRQVAWFGTQPYLYRYAQHTKQAQLWTPPLLAIKQRVEQVTGERFDTCLLNFYQHGEQGMGWHSDNEPELKREGVIVSISFGAERKFVFKHKATKHKVELWLANGSALIMGGPIQQYWLHTLPKTKKVNQPRINLTFRQMAK